MKSSGPRILTVDIETAPIESYHWSIWQENIGLDQIRLDWSILSFSAKWLDNPKVHYAYSGGRGVSKVRDDKELLQKLWDFLNEADIVIAQNGKRFDVKKINARMVMKGFKPYSPIKVVDTMLVAKKHFGFTSNKLAWLSEILTTVKKDKHKLFPGFELWSECLKDNRKAWQEMEKYNKIDVVATEELYLKLRPWMEGHPNVGAYLETDSPLCPRCGSGEVQMRGRTFTQTGEYHRFCCNACGGWSRSRYTLNSTSKRKSLLSN
jgi:RNase_H superfamily